MYGARAGHVEAVRRLLAHGARPEATEGAGYTALHAAAANGRLEAAAALLDAGSDMAARGVDGMAPLVRVRVRARARVRVRLRVSLARVRLALTPALPLPLPLPLTPTRFPSWRYDPRSTRRAPSVSRPGHRTSSAPPQRSSSCSNAPRHVTSSRPEAAAEAPFSTPPTAPDPAQGGLQPRSVGRCVLAAVPYQPCIPHI